MGHKISIDLYRSGQKSNTITPNSEISNIQPSIWFANKQGYSKSLIQDVRLRTYLEKRVSSAGLAKIIIRRYFRKLEIILFVTKPGIVIGKGGAQIQELKASLFKNFQLPKDTRITIEEFRDPFRSAKIIANDLSNAISKNISYRKLAKMTLEKIKYSGIIGAKIRIKGRLNKAEIARKEDFAFGSVPRHTISCVIDYAHVHCLTTAGIIGITVMLNKGNQITNYTY